MVLGRVPATTLRVLYWKASWRGTTYQWNSRWIRERWRQGGKKPRAPTMAFPTGNLYGYTATPHTTPVASASGALYRACHPECPPTPMR
eukprot:scaffold95797_cov28-Tisochrysis_lutea.AAC.3